MKNTTRLNLIVAAFSFAAIACMTASSSLAQSRKYSNEFLAIGVGARSIGMSNAYIASVNDVTAGYWNPAGLLLVKSNIQIAAMHSEQFAGIVKYDYGAFTTSIDTASAFGLSLIRLGVDDIPNTIDLIDSEGNIRYDLITSFSVADYAAIFSYARKLKIEGLRVGANAKIIHRKAGEFARAWGFGLDVGAQYDYKGWIFATMIRDITTTYNAWSFDIPDNMVATFNATGNVVPENSVEITRPKILLGAARQFIIKEKISILPEFDLDISTDGKRNVLIKGDPFSIDPHLGVEFGYNSIIFLRTGVGNIQKIKGEIGSREITTFQPNLGLGVRLRNLTIDWAMTDIGDQSVALYSHIFSLKLDLYKK